MMPMTKCIGTANGSKMVTACRMQRPDDGGSGSSAHRMLYRSVQ